jgi:hypothetical protein
VYDPDFSLDYGNAFGSHFLTCPMPFLPAHALRLYRIVLTLSGPDAVYEGKGSTFYVQTKNFPPLLGRVRLSFVTTGAGRATFQGGSTEHILNNSDLILGIPVPVVVVGGTISSTVNDIKLKAEMIEYSGPPPPAQKPFTVADSIVTKDVIVVAWV